MSSRYPNWLAVWLVTLLAPAAHATTNVSGDGAVTRFPGGDDAYSGSLTLQQTTQNGGFLVGLSDTRFPVGSLSVASVDFYRAATQYFVVTAGASLGDANTGTAHDSNLYKVRLAVDARIDAQWSVRLADQFIDLDQVHGHLMNVGAEFRPTTQWAIDLTGGYALSGTLPDRYGQLAVNWFGTEHVYGGVVFGRTGYDPANLGENASIRRLFQVYAGVSTPVPHGTLSVSVDTLNLEGESRQTIRIGFMEPIKP